MKLRPSRNLLVLFTAAVAMFVWVGPASGG